MVKFLKHQNYCIIYYYSISLMNNYNKIINNNDIMAGHWKSSSELLLFLSGVPVAMSITKVMDSVGRSTE